MWVDISHYIKIALFWRWSTIAREFDTWQRLISEMIVLPSDIIRGKFQQPTLISYWDMPCRLDQRVTWLHINRYISRRIRFQTTFLMWIWISLLLPFQRYMTWPCFAIFFSIPPMTSSVGLITSGWRKKKSRLRWHSWYTMNMCAKFQGRTMPRSKVFGKHTDRQTDIITFIIIRCKLLHGRGHWKKIIFCDMKVFLFQENSF